VSAVLRADRYAMAGMHALLQRWGRTCELIRGWHGYPTSDPSWKAIFGSGGEMLPIPDIQSVVIRINQKIMALPDDNMNAVTIWYAWQMNPGGGWWSTADKALVLGINEHTLRSRVRRAKELLLESAGELTVDEG
jgi:hypothetical protein